MVTQPGSDHVEDPQGEEIDWKARSEELKADNERLAKEANDARSERIGTLKTDARDQLLTSLDTRVEGVSSRISGIEKGVELLLDAANGDPEAAKQAYAKVQQDTRQSIQDADWDTYYQAKGAELLQLSKDDSGAELVSVDSDPALDSVRTQWLSARDRKDRTGIEAALSQAKDVIYPLKFKPKEEVTKEAAEEDSKETSEKTEDDLFTTMDTGPTSGGTGIFGSADAVRNAFLSGRINNDKYEQEMRRLK